MRVIINIYCHRCGEDITGDYCEYCADNAPLESAARDYIRGDYPTGDAGDIFTGLPERE